MRNFFQYIASLFLVSFCLGSCELTKLSDPVVVSDVENEYDLRPWEKLSANGRSFQLQLSTRKNQPCKNAVIDFELTRTGNRIALSLRSIETPQDCAPGDESIRAIADAGSLPAGFYELSIDLENTVFNSGQLTVTGSRYLLNMESSDGFTLLHQELYRVPQESIWGYITYDHNDSALVAQDFVAELSQHSTGRMLDKGYYGYFQVSDNNNKVAIAARPATNRIMQFVFQLQQGRLDEVRALLDKFRNEYDGTLDIKLFTWQGEEI